MLEQIRPEWHRIQSASSPQTDSR